MTRVSQLKHQFVEFIPDELDDATLYVSMEYGTVRHRCCCGCGEDVVTPLSPTDWKLIYDGDTISLHPSIGNWSYECHSHYWIAHGKVVWADTWEQDRIDAGRRADQRSKQVHYEPPATAINKVDETAAPEPDSQAPMMRLLRWLAPLFRR